MCAERTIRFSSVRGRLRGKPSLTVGGGGRAGAASVWFERLHFEPVVRMGGGGPFGSRHFSICLQTTSSAHIAHFGNENGQRTGHDSEIAPKRAGLRIADIE